MKWMWFSSGTLCGLSVLSLSFASVPTPGRVTDDTVIYENLSEIRAAKTGDLNFDRDLDHLSDMESQYRGRPQVRRPTTRTRAYRTNRSNRAARPKSNIRQTSPARGRSARVNRVQQPMSRIGARTYRYSGHKTVGHTTSARRSAPVSRQ